MGPRVVIAAAIVAMMGGCVRNPRAVLVLSQTGCHCQAQKFTLTLRDDDTVVFEEFDSVRKVGRLRPGVVAGLSRAFARQGFLSLANEYCNVMIGPCTWHLELRDGSRAKRVRFQGLSTGGFRTGPIRCELPPILVRLAERVVAVGVAPGWVQYEQRR